MSMKTKQPGVMYKRERTSEKRSDYDVSQMWHIRKIRRINHTLAVCLPFRLIRFARSMAGTPQQRGGDWQEGDYVKVGLTHTGRFTIKLIPGEQLDSLGVNRGIDTDVDRSDTEVQHLKAPDLPPALSERRIRTVNKSGLPGDYEQCYEIIRKKLNEQPKEETPWSDEVRNWRRLGMDLTQKQAALTLHVTGITISSWERGRTEPGKENRKWYQHVMGLCLKAKTAEHKRLAAKTERLIRKGRAELVKRRKEERRLYNLRRSK